MDTSVNFQEELFNSLFHSKGYGIAMIDPGGKWIECNETLLSLFGYTKEELFNLTNLDVTHPDDRESTNQMFKDILKKKKDYHRYEKRYVRKNGSPFWVDVLATPVCNKTGKIIAISGIIAEISGRKKMQEALQKSEEEYRSLFDGANDSIFIMDENEFLECNQMTLIMFGCQKKEIINHPPWEFSPPRQPDGSDSKEKASGYIRAAMRGEPQRFYWKHAKMDGTPFDGEVSLSRMVMPGNIRLQAIVRDITERKMAELEIHRSREAFKAYFELGSTGMLVITPGKKCIEANTRVCQMLGYSKEELKQLTWDQITYPDDLNSELELFNRILSGEQSSYDIEKRFIKKDGSVIYTTISVTSQRGENGSLDYILASLIDITDRKLAEQDYLREKALMDQLFETSPEAISFSDENGQFLRANSKFLELFGFSTAEVVGKEIDDLITRGNMKDEAKRITREVNTGKTIELETVRYRKDGTPIDVSLVATSIHLGDIFIGGYGIYRDITDRKKAEKALRESETLYRNLIENMADGVYKSTHEGKFIEVNPAMVKMLGYESKEEMMSIDIKTQLYFEPSERDNLLEEEKQGAIGVYRLKRKDHSEIWVEDHGWYNYDESGNIISHEGILRDVTKRLQVEKKLSESEERLRSLFENVLIGLYRTTPDGEILFSNPALIHILGFKNFEELAQRNLEQKGFEPEYLRKDFKEQIERDGAIIGLESKWSKYDGTTIFVRESAKAYHDNKGNISYYEGTVEDITDRKLAELKLEKQTRQLQEINATKDKFFSIIAHDLKNPFNTILGFSDVLITDFHELEKDEIFKYLSMIHNSSKQAYSLLENLLLWARTQTGNIAFQPQLFDLRSCILDIIELCKNQSARKNISLSSDIKSHSFIIADKNMVNTIILNLLSNAIKFTPQDGKVNISVNTRKDCFEISIRDTGIGISPENIDNIFRLDRKTTTLGTERETGSGLGLILCKEFVSKHGGALWVESESGKGSTFKFTIPTAN